MVAYEPDRDFYKLLGLKPHTASSETIVRQAYLKSARKAHPDRDRANDAATGNFQDIQEAYETLRDPSRKTRYDKAIVEWSRREDLRKLDEACRREESLNRATRSRRRAAPASASSGQSGQDKYFGYETRAPKPAATAKPPPGASTAWEEMKRASRAKPGQPQTQKSANPPQRPGPHPTSKTPKKPASQRPGSFAQWAKDNPAGPGTPGKNGGYRPDSSTIGDEPQAKNTSYSSAKKPEAFFVYDSSESDSDSFESMPKSRAGQPYPKTYAEKTKLFDERSRNSEEESRRARQANGTTTPKKDGPPAGSQSFWPHPETTPDFSSAKRSEKATPADPSPFERKPNESPGPWFAEAPPSAFAFTAGSETSTDAPPVRKARSSGHLGRKNTASPTKRRRPETSESPAQPAEPVPVPVPVPSPRSFKFDWAQKAAKLFPAETARRPVTSESPAQPAEPVHEPSPRTTFDWTQALKADKFFPRSPASPITQQTPFSLKRSATMGASSSSTPQRATVVDDNSADEGGAGVKGDGPRPAGAAYAPSPNAMDIDSPPMGPTPVRTFPSTRTRAVPVEPSKPEWRAGTGAGQAKEAPKKVPVPLKPTAGGSEDTGDFRATLEDLKNVPPFAPQGGGLGAFGDLKSSLPFSSMPSESIPHKPRKPREHRDKEKDKELEMPSAPTAPIFPVPVGPTGIRPTREIVETYVRAFESYIFQWDTWNGIIVSHFHERQKLAIKEARGGEIGAAKMRVRKRLVAARQDGEVRRRWGEEVDRHEKRVSGYLEVLEKMGL